MSDQPEALRLADRLEKVRLFGVEEECWEAADELRRLAAVEADFHMTYRMKCDAETKRLQAERDAAVRALRIIAGYDPCVDNLMSNQEIARAAIDAAKEDK